MSNSLCSWLTGLGLAVAAATTGNLKADIEAPGSYLFTGAVSASDEFSQVGNPPGFTEITISSGPDFNSATANIDIPGLPSTPEARLGGVSEIGGFSANQSARTVSNQTIQWVATSTGGPTIPIDVTFSMFGQMGVSLSSNKNLNEVLSRVGLEMVVGTTGNMQTVYFSDAFINDGTGTLKFNPGATGVWQSSFSADPGNGSGFYSYFADYAETIPGLFTVNDGEIFSVTTTLYTDAFLTQAQEESVNTLFGDIMGGTDGRGLRYSLSVDPDGGQLNVFVPEPGAAGLLGVMLYGLSIRRRSRTRA